jgi:hypothetical protein
MTNNLKKKSTARWRIKAALLALLAAYPLSFGPACWIASRADLRSRLLPLVYRPILKLMSWQEVRELGSRPPEGDNWEKGANTAALRHSLFSWYAELGAKEGAHWFYTVRYEKRPGEPAQITGEEWRWP